MPEGLEQCRCDTNRFTFPQFQDYIKFLAAVIIQNHFKWLIEEHCLRNGTIAYRFVFLDKQALQTLVPEIRIGGSFYLKAKQNKTKQCHS